jgi:hypothetical protein
MARTMGITKLFRNVLLLLLSMIFGGPNFARAQVSVGGPPPTYDYILSEPGTQPPSVLGGPITARELVTYSVRVGVFVPLAELQALLPPGFLARATPAGSDTAAVFLNFFFQTRMERPGAGAGFGNFGPYTSLQVQTSVVNPANEIEGFFWLANLVSNPGVVPLQNSIFGPGSSRAARLKFEIEEEEGITRVKAHAKSKELGLNLSVVAEAPTAAFANRFGGNNLSRSRFQNQDNPVMTNSQALFVVQGDNAGNQPADNVELSTTELRLPGGDLHVVAVGGFTFLRNVEHTYRIP